MFAPTTFRELAALWLRFIGWMISPKRPSCQHCGARGYPVPPLRISLH